MKLSHIFTTFICFSTLSIAFANNKDKTICEDPQTQFEMNNCANKGYKSTDEKLNQVYKLIQKKYANDSAFLNKLKIAQKAWLQYRDAQLDMMYPHKNENDYYGSVFGMCENNYLEKLTIERIKILQQWLDGTEEGDVCSGSILPKT